MGKRLRILFIEDSDTDVLLILRHLEGEGYDVAHRRVETPAGLAAALAEGEWDLVLCDYRVPGYDPKSALNDVKASGDEIPFIMISGVVGEAALVEIMKAGAHDVILKDKLKRLGPAIERELAETAVRREQRRAEAALRESENMLTTFMDHVPAEVLIKDVEGRYLLVNREVSRRYGLNQEEAKGKSVHELFRGIGTKQTLAEDREVLETGAAVIREERVVCADGERTNLAVRFPVKDSAGEVVKIGLIATDITDRMRNEETLRLYERAMEASSNGIVITDAGHDDHPIIYCNPAFERMTGYSAAEVVGRNCRFLQGEDRNQAALQELRAATKERRFASVVLRNYRKGGDLFWCEISIAPVRNGDGEVTHFIGIQNDITDRKHAEEALRSSEGRFSSLVSNISGAVYRSAYDEHWTVGFFSDAIADICGCPVSDFLNNEVRSYASIVHPADLGFLQDAVATAVESKKSYSVRYRIRHADGQTRWVWDKGVGVFDENGEVMYLDGTIFDITDQREGEDALRESEKRLAKAQRLAKIAHWRWSLDRERLLYTSDEYYRILGMTRDEAPRCAKDFSRIIHPDDLARAVEFCRSLASDPHDYEIEYRIVRPNGEIRHVMEIGEISRSETGEPIGHTGTIQDITTLKRTEEEKRTLEQLLTGILDNVPEAVVSVNQSGRIVLFSKGAEAVFGYRATEAIGKPFDILVPERLRRDQEGLLAGFMRAVESERDSYRRRQFEGLHKDGTEFPAEASLSTLTLKGETILTTMLYDITDRMAAEQQLRQAQKMEAVGQLSGGMAHDFNNVLAAVIGNLDLLDRALKDNERQHRWVSTAMRAAQRGADLTRRMLAFARRQELRPSVIDCGETLRGLSGLLQQSLGSGVELEIVIADDLWPIEVDQAQLEHALLNLGINARDAMPDGGCLCITAENASLTNGDARSAAEFVALSLSDSGSGMSPEVLDRVIEPFFTTKEAGKGTGLGLSMVYGFVEQSGGKFEIESEENRGTTARLYLPRAEAQAPAREAAEESDDYPTGSETILVVEDEPDVRDTAAEFLRELGYQVVEADRGAAALAEIDRKPDIDLLFTDIVMPGGMDGLGLARAVRKLRPELKVLYTSGNLNSRLLRGESADAANAFLRKPYLNGDLAQRVRAVLDGSLS